MVVCHAEARSILGYNLEKDATSSNLRKTNPLIEISIIIYCKKNDLVIIPGIISIVSKLHLTCRKFFNIFYFQY